MNNYAKTEKLLRALASESRLQILECIQKGIANPGEIAKNLNRHRATVEKHLKVLLDADIIEKVPSLSRGGQLTILTESERRHKDFLLLFKRFPKTTNRIFPWLHYV